MVWHLSSYPILSRCVTLLVRWGLHLNVYFMSPKPLLNSMVRDLSHLPPPNYGIGCHLTFVMQLRWASLNHNSKPISSDRIFIHNEFVHYQYFYHVYARVNVLATSPLISTCGLAMFAFLSGILSLIKFKLMIVFDLLRLDPAMPGINEVANMRNAFYVGNSRHRPLF